MQSYLLCELELCAIEKYIRSIVGSGRFHHMCIDFGFILIDCLDLWFDKLNSVKRSSGSTICWRL